MGVPATVRWLENDQEAGRVEGNFGLAMNNYMKVNGNLVKRPREDKRTCHWKNDQTAEPQLEEGRVLRVFFDNHTLEIEFGSVQDALNHRDMAAELWQKKSGAKEPKAREEVVPPKPAPEAARKKRQIDDGGFMSLSAQNNLVSRAESELSNKRRLLETRFGTRSPERPLLRPSHPPLKRVQAARSSLLQRRASNPLQDSSIYQSYRSSVTFGLSNLGNTCYLNAVTQAVGSTREFVADLTAMAARWPHCTDGPLFKCTVDILQRLQETQAAPLSPAKLREQIAVAAPMFQGSGQQDAHEFFLEYINQLHDELLRGHKEWLSHNALAGADPEPVLATQNHFDAELLKQLTCTQCGRSRAVTERFRDFSLDFSPDAASVEAMFQSYFDPEMVEAKCEHCQAPSAQLETYLSEAPRVLVLHLKRFVPNMEKQCYEKQHQSLQIPYTLDVDRLLGRGGTTGPGASPPRLPARPLASAASPAGGQADAEGEVEDRAQPLVFNLRALVCHEGASPRSGHYVCYAETAKGDWCLYDDSRVKQFAPGEEPWTALGSKAYMLFYVQCGQELPTKDAAGA